MEFSFEAFVGIRMCFNEPLTVCVSLNQTVVCRTAAVWVAVDVAVCAGGLDVLNRLIRDAVQRDEASEWP